MQAPMSQALSVIEHQLLPLRPMFGQLLKPTGVPAERIIRSVLISCERTPRLLECTPLSVIQAATTGAVLGLEADGHTGQGFLVPFRQKGQLKAQWITGYKGYNTLAARVGLTINGDVVREGDFFEFEKGSSGFVRHKPMIGGGQNRRIIGAWATASAPGREPIIEWLDIDDILAIKQRSQAAKKDGGDEAFSPWNEPLVGFPAMAAKSAKRRLARSLPLSVYLAAARVDEAHEEQGHHAWLHPEKGIVIDGEAAPPPAQTQGPPVEALERKQFAIRRNKGEAPCNSIEEWRGRMLEAIRRIAAIENVERFRELNQPLIDGYRDEFPRDVAAVESAFAQRLKESGQGGQSSSTPTERRSAPQQRSPRQEAADIARTAARPRDELFWSSSILSVPGKTARDLEYWITHRLKETRHRGEIDRLENDNLPRIVDAPRATKDAIVSAIAARRRELRGPKR